VLLRLVPLLLLLRLPLLRALLRAMDLTPVLNAPTV
jgi:hypothetical protein